MTNLTIFERSLPLRAYPPKDLDRFLDTEFKFWLANLLNLKSDKEDAYDTAKDAIKVQCIGMGFSEIKKMFEDYVDSKLNITPIPNYFDRILLGKIVSAYKQQNKPKIKIPEKMNDDIRLQKEYDNLIDEVKRTKHIESPCVEVYDWLDSKDTFDFSDDFKREMFTRAKASLLSEESKKDFNDWDSAIFTEIKKGNIFVINKAKKFCLEHFLRQ